MQLTQGQIKVIAASVGMKNPDVMAAIAMAESGGRTGAHNATPPDDSYGLWQINMLGDMGPARRKSFGISKNTDLYNPLINAQAAKKIQGSQGLAAWSTYTNGAYRRYMGKAEVVQADWWDDFKKGFGDGFDFGPGVEDFWDGGTENDPGLSDVPGVEQLTDLVDFFAKAGNWISDPTNWIRIAYVIGGAALVIGGLVLVARTTIVQAAIPSVKEAV